MEPDKKYFMVGTFVLSVIAAVFFFAMWVTKASDRSNYKEYRIRFAESVSGLSVGSPVKFRGVDVGKVDTIEIDPANPNLIKVDVRLIRSAPVKTDTVASLKLQGITGVSFVELSGGSPNLPDLEPTAENEIPEIPAESSGINAIVNRMPELVDKTTAVADQAAKLLSDENVASVTEMLAHWNNIATALDSQTQAMTELLERSNHVVGNLDEITENSKQDIKELTRSLRETSDHLNAFIHRTDKVAGSHYEEIYQVLNEIKSASRDIRGLVKSLEERPSRIVLPAEEKGIPAP